MSEPEKKPFRFKQFAIYQEQARNKGMKVGTDGVLLGAWANIHQAHRILDIGTGTGLIALMLAQRHATAKIDAIEIEFSAFSQAIQNVRISRWYHRICVIHSPIQQYRPKRSLGVYDLIVSNPPYFKGGTTSTSSIRNQVRHTTLLSHRDLLKAVQRLLALHGQFCLILPRQEGIAFQQLALDYQLYCTKKIAVKGRKHKPVERWLMQFERFPKSMQTGELVIQKGTGRHDYTTDYVALTKDFYLFM